MQLSNVAYRIQYIPGVETPQEDDERPPAPTGLRLFRQYNERILTWFAPPADKYDVIEVYSSITNNRADSEFVGETKGSAFVYTPANRGTLYYWVRSQKDANFSEWNPVSATGGLSNDANLPESQRLVPDPEFTLGGDEFWSIEEGENSVAILSSGGVAGGVARFILGGGSGSGNSYLGAHRLPAMQATTGQAIEMTVRWRRTTTVSDASSQVVLSVQLASSDDPLASGVVNSVLLSGAGTDRSTDLDSFTVNEWQEIRAVFRLQNNPKSSAQFPYLRVGVFVDGGTGTGTVEIDRVDAIFAAVI